MDDYTDLKLRQARQRREAIERGNPSRNEFGQPAKPLSADSINKTINTLQSILSYAEEYGHITKNPAAGRRRQLKVEKRRPVFLDTVDQIVAMLDAAEELDRSTRWLLKDRRAAIAVLMFAGPRAQEFGHALWRDVDLANRRIHIGRSKTQAGLREIDLLPILYHALVEHKQTSRYTAPDDPIFASGTGGLRDKDSVRFYVVAPTTARADELLREREQLPKGITSHKLRHTFASILVACGTDPTSLMAQIGHTDPQFTLRVYAHMMRRNPHERARLKALVNCSEAYDADEQIAG